MPDSSPRLAIARFERSCRRTLVLLLFRLCNAFLNPSRLEETKQHFKSDIFKLISFSRIGHKIYDTGPLHEASGIGFNATRICKAAEPYGPQVDSRRILLFQAPYKIFLVSMLTTCWSPIVDDPLFVCSAVPGDSWLSNCAVAEQTLAAANTQIS